jgi:hypothetical protein
VKILRKHKEPPKGEDEDIRPQVIDVGIFGEKAQVYTRKARTPSPKESLVKEDSPINLFILQQ